MLTVLLQLFPFRYVTQKKYTEACDLMYNGSSTLLQHNQHGSGVDLALLLVDVLNKATAQVNDDLIGELCLWENCHRKLNNLSQLWTILNVKLFCIQFEEEIWKLIFVLKLEIGSYVDFLFFPDKLGQLHSMIKTDHIERPNFANQALRWSCQGSEERKTGHPQLHQKFAMTFWRGMFNLENFVSHICCSYY